MINDNMKYILKNRYLEAVAKSILVFAALHILAVTIYALGIQDILALNIFHILQFNLLWPEIIEGEANFIISYVFFIIIYGAVYLKYTSKEK